MRLDKFLTRRGTHPCKEVSRLLQDGRVRVDGAVETRGLRRISRFSRIELDREILQAQDAVHLMLHKPAGYLSATTDPQHPTVMELIDHPLRDELHLAGRLDRASTGLLLLTNNGRWSKAVTEPLEEISKVYRVTTRDEIPPETAAIFAAGIYFAYEDLTTRPALLEIIAEREANGPFTGFDDFIARVDGRAINKRVLEHLRPRHRRLRVQHAAPHAELSPLRVLVRLCKVPMRRQRQHEPTDEQHRVHRRRVEVRLSMRDDVRAI